MIDKLEKIKQRYDELSNQLMDAGIIANRAMYQKLAKEHASLSELAEAHDKYKGKARELKDCEQAVARETDPEMRKMFADEAFEAKKAIEALNEQIKVLLLPKDENDDNNVIIEIRGGAGGEEASLFAQDLYRMYTMFAAARGWKTELMYLNETELGGIKEVSFMIYGHGAFRALKFESGVHRVQRVPETEAQGRIHTSTVTVAVLPEISDVDVEINDKDLKIDTYCASGAGGQHVNKTESACRVTHLPTGIVVTCQDERSLIKNREKALKVLYARLYDVQKEQRDAEYAKNRKDQVGTGDRSERIRTYNFPQGRVTDHRVNMSVFNITEFMNGAIDEMLETLLIDYQKRQLENEN